MSKTNLNHINKELKKWVISSQKVKTTTSIMHAKILSHIAIYESKANVAEISKLQSDMGKILSKLLYFSIFFFIFRRCIEGHLQKL